MVCVAAEKYTAGVSAVFVRGDARGERRCRRSGRWLQGVEHCQLGHIRLLLRNVSCMLVTTKDDNISRYRVWTSFREYSSPRRTKLPLDGRMQVRRPAVLKATWRPCLFVYFGFTRLRHFALRNSPPKNKISLEM
ncbi:hypothetical protein WAI453_007602 [Rhynchosporium graminicola]